MLSGFDCYLSIKVMQDKASVHQALAELGYFHTTIALLCYVVAVAAMRCCHVPLALSSSYRKCTNTFKDEKKMIKLMTYIVAPCPFVIPPCVASSTLVGTKEEKKHSKCATNLSNSYLMD